MVGHFGPELRRFVLAQYHQGQVTVLCLVAQLRGIGIAISKRQMMRLLIAGQDGFLAENRDVLRAGLQTAAWITVDDTGARHAGRNGFCTQIGNDEFGWFGTRPSKSRLNFLDLLRAGHTDYVINDAALDICAGEPWRDLPSISWPHINGHGSPIRWPGRRISTASASAQCRSHRTQSASPPKGHCGAASTRTGCCATW